MTSTSEVLHPAGTAAIRRPPAASWLLVLGVTILAALSAAYVALTPAGGQTELAGRTWEDFAAGEAEVASIFSRQLAMVGLIGAAFALLAAIVALFPYRRGERWAWYALWLVPITFGGVAARMLVDEYSVGFYYVVLAAVAAIGLALGARSSKATPDG